MPLLTYPLTFNFARSIVWFNDAQVPQEMEVTVVPLANPSFPDMGTYVGGMQSQTVLLSDETNSVTFNLVPTNAAGLTEPVNYRAEWRSGGITGRLFSQPFAMPSQAVTFDQLATLSDFVTGTDYIQQTQIGVAGGIAGLNSSGEVVDATNTPVAQAGDVTTLTSLIDAEVVNRASAIGTLTTLTANNLSGAINALASTVAGNLSSAIADVNATIFSNYDELDGFINAEVINRTNAVGALTTLTGTHTSEIAALTISLASCATLTGGYLTPAQIPPILQLNAYGVSNEAGMLALSASSNNGSLPPIHYADIAIWENGVVWMLLGSPSSPNPSVLSNWLCLTSVYSVNGETGPVTLAAADVGAVGINGTSGAITQAQVTGLATTLSGYAPLSSYTTLNATVSGILANTNYVMLDTTGPSTGYINHARNDSSMAYVNGLGQVTLKNGTVIASGTGTVLSVNGYEVANVVLAASDVGAIAVGASIAESQVTGLLTDLSNRALTSDSRLTNARTPTAHATSHQDGGTDVLTLGQDQVTGLTSALALLAPLTTTVTQANQISALQSAVAALGGTPESNPIKTIWFDGTGTFTGASTPAVFQTTYSVEQKSPFGKSASTGLYYYNPAGASAGEWVYPYITAGGHLDLRVWNESNPPDPIYATSTQITTINNTIATLATNASLAALQTQVSACALQSSVNTINTTLGTLATQASVNALSTQVGNAATQAALNSTNATIANLATSASVSTLSSTVATKANQSDMTTAQANIASLQAQQANQASLTGPGLTVPLSQMPENIPISSISGLATSLAGLCPLVSGLVPLANLPENIPQSYVYGLVTALSSLCPLVGGQIPSQYLPSLAITAVFTAANEAAMLALSATVGDVCVITGTSAAGTYILASTPASSFTNWVLMPNVQDVTSVNGQQGIVNLTAANVGAMAIGVAIPQSQVTGLASTLSTFATTTALTAAVSGLQSLSQVQGILTASTGAKQLVNYVASTAISSLAGQQSIDGVLTPIGSIVLATAQSSSVNNGLWVVQPGTWARTSDFATGAYFVRGSLAFVASGTQFANTIWQETGSSGVIDTSPNNWTNIMAAGGPIPYAAGNGITLTSTTFSSKVVSGGGLSVSSAGLAIDTSVTTRHTSGYVPAGNTVASITHNLNTQSVSVVVRETASGNRVELCDTVTGPNTVTLEFGVAPTTNQFTYLVLG